MPLSHQRLSHKELNINKDGDLWETKLVFSVQYSSFLQNPVIFFKKSTLFSCNGYLIEFIEESFVAYSAFFICFLIPKIMKNIGNLAACEKVALKVLATIPYFNFHFFPHLLIFLQFRDPSYVLNLSTKAVMQK